jgi:prepilin-type N-terminal cleavage/methylation domain-containing protein
MNASPSLRRSAAFTLVELLVVISIIAILAGLLLPTLAAVKRKAQVNSARMDIKNLELAISQYESDYSRLPANTGTPPGGPHLRPRPRERLRHRGRRPIPTSWPRS